MLKKFQKRRENTKNNECGRGMLVFENTTQVIRAESLLKKQGMEIKVMGPPSYIRTGCDLVIEFPLIQELAILRLLKDSNTVPMQTVPVSSELLEPVDLLHEKRYGKYLMIRAANMKITVDTETRMIVNVSGGGCPDVPYLAGELVGKRLDEAPEPRDIGHTLCAYALQLALDRVVTLC
ncbi:DUF3343 domain-containing protein [Alkalibacter mobilis]|uniref:DUF3343 domain-containing protein n=1 Tax=Alkalibacter mobilis TaxID=2787712 RepID=UPI00189C8164|nr:DUF3343 domain-containing protein [Alkalibacter mobilis]MBF7096289.1 DUF3343 domain-containing protein [Alkalibacter mobilis]